MQLRTPLPNRKASAFTLIEMIGVLAVIAILAALLIPKVFEAINNARINSATVSYNTVKTALTDHYAKYSSLLSSNGVAIPVAAATDFDQILLTEGFLDKPFETKIGTSASVEIVTGLASNTTSTSGTIATGVYALSGNTAVNDAGPAGAAVVQAVIQGVSESDAKELNDRLDGAGLGSALGADDLVGRVKYISASPTTVYMYVTHR